MSKWVYSFAEGQADGTSQMRDLLGGKGANLAEMCTLGLPVPPGFTITTAVCTHYYAHDRQYPGDLAEQVTAAMAKVEDALGWRFGDADNPLLVSVRSGARASMPGMMDTVLNLGLNDDTVQGLVRRSGDQRFAYDSYRRFIQMYASVVLNLDHHDFEDVLEEIKRDTGKILDPELTGEEWQEVIDGYKRLVERDTGAPFPQSAQDQLWGAIGAVFGSWNNNRAKYYRRMHSIPDDWGTAVNVQAMVFGNMGEDCATGVAFTRDPSTGENIFYGEYLVNAQGEDVVAGIRTPQHLTIAGKHKQGSDLPAMEEVMPDVFRQLVAVRERLEHHYRDMQDIEFTVQQNKLYMLQTRNGKRTSSAALQIAVDMVAEGVITKEEAISRIEPQTLDQLLHPTLDPDAAKQPLCKGLPASPGAASGIICFSADEAEALARKGEAVILCRVETSPEDIHGMHAASGILTSRGGMTSHAAVVARGMGRACVSGAGELTIDYRARTLRARGRTLAAGELITLDGSTGEVFIGEVATLKPELGGAFAQLMQWADEVRRMRVRTNAETPADVQTARDFGAEGIGLCRTEHMFFDAERIMSVRRMILADDEAGRRAALAELEPMQKADFIEIFRIMRGLPVTIRLLDPPLHEFLPHEAEFAEVAVAAAVELPRLRERVDQLSEANPMLGHRGCRLGISYPEIYEMQARAIFEAAASVQRDSGEGVEVEVMIPLVATKRELEILREMVDRIAQEVQGRTGVSLSYIVGTMIELPRACLRAGDIAEQADFFSFGTNDLTQTTLGLSRDDAGAFLPTYVDKGIYETDPFVSLDTGGPGELVQIAAERGRAVRTGLKLGICGEHGGDPASIDFCESLALDYVSCSPYRVPVARLAAAQAALKRRPGAGQSA